jgi:hypothetical protein
MSLVLDKFFFRSLSTDTTITSITDGRIFNTGRATKDDNEDKVPYIIITFEGLANDVDTKDCSYESDDDKVLISIMCVASTREELAQLTEAVRVRNREFAELAKGGTVEIDEVPIDWNFSADKIQYDYTKPCYYQTLNYECECENINDVNYDKEN